MHFKEANKCIKMVTSEKVNMVYPELGHVACWKIMTFGDGAHANLPDKVSSSSGHIVFLVDENGSSCPLIWASNKIQRIVRSSLSTEAMTMQDSVESSLYIKEMLHDVLSSERGVKLPIKHITDNISLKNAIYSNSQVKDKRLRIDLASLKQEISREKILVKWILGGKMLADALSKKTAPEELLQNVLSVGRLELQS